MPSLADTRVSEVSDAAVDTSNQYSDIIVDESKSVDDIDESKYDFLDTNLLEKYAATLEDLRSSRDEKLIKWEALKETLDLPSFKTKLKSHDTVGTIPGKESETSGDAVGTEPASSEEHQQLSEMEMFEKYVKVCIYKWGFSAQLSGVMVSIKFHLMLIYFETHTISFSQVFEFFSHFLV